MLNSGEHLLVLASALIEDSASTGHQSIPGLGLYPVYPDPFHLGPEAFLTDRARLELTRLPPEWRARSFRWDSLGAVARS